jgi:hypothetical protein
LERLPDTGTARCRALFTTHAKFSDITPTQYDAAHAWLTETGLLADLHSNVPVRLRVFASALLSAGTHWLPDADLLVRDPSELPEDALRTARALDLDQDQAYEQLQAAWGKVDLEERSRIGAAGEAALVELLTASTAARIEHVAAYSDGFGYDIAVHAGRHSLHLEVKATLRRNRLAIYLSRHEFETMLRDSHWLLVLIRMSRDDLNIDAVGSLSNDWISSQVPRDHGVHGRWQSCRLEVPQAEVTAGIPGLNPILLTKGIPNLLEGAGHLA